MTAPFGPNRAHGPWGRPRGGNHFHAPGPRAADPGIETAQWHLRRLCERGFVGSLYSLQSRQPVLAWLILRGPKPGFSILAYRTYCDSAPPSLPRKLDAPLAGQGRAGTSACAPGGPRRRHCNTSSWRAAPREIGNREQVATIQMVEVWIPMLDGRWLMLPRHTQPEKDVQAMLDHIQITLPSQPPPRIRASQVASSTSPEAAHQPSLW